MPAGENPSRPVRDFFGFSKAGRYHRALCYLPAPVRLALGGGTLDLNIPPLLHVRRAFAPVLLGLACVSGTLQAQSAEAVLGTASVPAVRIGQGQASWYGKDFHQRPTASGERFDMHGFTAAHPKLPFGSQVCVRSLVSGRSVKVRINDRGPYTHKRIIDLSYAAAKVLGMVQRGTKRVELLVLKNASASCPGNA